MVGAVVMAVVLRLPVLALFGMPGGVVGLHRCLSGTVRQGRNHGREHKHKK